MSNRKTLDERIAAAKEEAEQKQARLKLLMQQQKAEERKARNHRLCKRGGLVESRLPRLALLDDEQFEVWMRKTLLSGFAEKILNEILPPPPAEQSGGDAEPQSAETAKTPQKPVANGNGKPAYHNGGNDNAGSGDAARVTG